LDLYLVPKCFCMTQKVLPPGKLEKSCNYIIAIVFSIKKHWEKLRKIEINQNQEESSQYVSEQEMQTNLASSDCTASAQCVAIYSIHNVKNTTTVTSLHYIPLIIPKWIGEVEIFFIFIEFESTKQKNKEYHVKINCYEVRQFIPRSFITCIHHICKWS